MLKAHVHLKNRFALSACAAAVGCAACMAPPAPDRSQERHSPVATQAELNPTAGLRCEADATSPQKTDYAKPGPYQVATLDITFEDRSRPIAATAAHAGAPSRTLPTTIYYPAATRAIPLLPTTLAQGGPFPLIMYSHGFGSSRGEASHVGQLAASYGYIVVSPDFPLTNTGRILTGEADLSDGPNQPLDVSFLIDQILALSRRPGHVLANAVDETRIGATGVSLGGFTTLLVTLHPELQDPRIRAAVPIAAVSSFFMPGFYHTREVPLLFIHGDLDAFVNYELSSRRAFERAAPNAQLITLARGSHAAFAMQLDASSLMLMNSLLAPPNADPTNPDGFGCGAQGEALRDAAPGFKAALGGEENFIASEDLMPPCLGDEYTHPAMDASEQVAIAASAVVAFFQAHFTPLEETRSDACRFLLHELPKNSAVTVE